MAHARTQIRAALAAIIDGGCPSVVTVAPGRATHRPFQVKDLPAVVIRTGGETIEALTIGQPTQQDRNADIWIDCYVQSDAPESAADQVALEVEKVLAVNRTLSGLCLDVVLAGIAPPDVDGSAETPVVVLGLRYLARYRTTNTAPDAPLA